MYWNFRGFTAENEIAWIRRPGLHPRRLKANDWREAMNEGMRTIQSVEGQEPVSWSGSDSGFSGHGFRFGAFEVDSKTGELRRELTSDPTKDYQPQKQQDPNPLP